MRVINKKRFILSLALFVLLILLLAAGVGCGFVYYQFFVPINTQTPERVFTINKGEGVKEIAATLEESGLIRDSIYFEYYVWYKDWAINLKAGEYNLSPALSIGQIAQRIFIGEYLSHELSVVIPEGFNLKEIDERLNQAGLIQEGKLAGQQELEGYLFPDTYRFNRDDGVDKIIKKMRDNFEKKIDMELRAEINQQGKTLEEIIIMASLIEKEVAKDEDRRLVSGIFWKRIDDNYPLESCATIAYVLGADKWRYSSIDTQIESLYNTYQNIGLPPGPICNPGLETIKAAIYPEQSDYYFFLSKPNGETVFSKTLKEHNENIKKYLTLD